MAEQKPKANLVKSLLPLIVVMAAMALIFQNFSMPNARQTLYFNEFMNELQEGSLKTVTIQPNDPLLIITGTYLKEGTETQFRSTIPFSQATLDEIMTELRSQEIAEVKTVDPNAVGFFVQMLISFGPTLLLIGLMFFMLSRLAGGGGANKQVFDMANSRARMETNRKVKFDSVAGSDEEKEEMTEIVSYLRNPKKYTSMGARIPKGVLLVGPPGTGKTLLARAVAGEANVPFYFVSGSEFEEMFVGVGAGRVRDMFKKAKQTAPCIIFIDEIDAVGRKRSGSVMSESRSEQTLNQLLVEMDGFDTNEGVIILAATNRADVLDPALLRPGRFDRQINIPLPDRRARTAIFEVHAKNKPLTSDINFDDLAQRTPGFSGAEIENTLNEAALMAVRNNHAKIDIHDIDEAIDRVIAGPAKKSRRLTEMERNTVAHHEAGHAVVGLKVEDADVVQKVTIIPRGDAGGYVLSTPKEDRFLYSKRMLMSRITGLLAGRASEQVFFDDISSGASDDIKKATNIAYQMVTQLGMSNLGTIQFEREDPMMQPYSHSDITHAEIDKEVKIIVDQCYKDAVDLIVLYKDAVHTVAKALLEYETLVKDEIIELVETGNMKPREEVLNRVDTGSVNEIE